MVLAGCLRVLKIFVETVSQSYSLIIRKRQGTLRLVIANEVDVNVVLGVVLIIGNSDGAHRFKP